jgi:predicted phage terminase large subunit-like protein|nr:MAG TPA: Terminase [Caudoviricetes sp.]DAV56839.1 MAG TPA: Terminase [Caudoviricetes sp.]
MQKFTEGSIEWYRAILNQIINDDMTVCQNQKDCLDLLLNMNIDLPFKDNPDARNMAMKVSRYAHTTAARNAALTGSGNFDDIYWQYLLMEAQNYQVDSGLLYLEKNRIPKERFYEPRRNVFLQHNIIGSLQDLMDDKLDIFALSVPPGCGKSTLEDFFLSLVGGWFPNDFNLSSAHSSILTRSLYDGVLEIINDPVEYTWHEIFPNVEIQGTNAKETTVNLERNGRFKTWTFRSIDGSLTGATRCNRFLTADDLVSGIEEALNKNRLDTLWTKVVNDLRSRRLEGCKEFYIATRWSVHDPIGKLQQLYAGNPRARFIAVPALDENGKSNFLFTVNGFSEKYFNDAKESMDEISYNCLYQQQPVEREGLLLPPDKLKRFFFSKEDVPDGCADEYIIIPDKNADAIWAICDTKDKGTDFESLPIAYQYGDKFFFPDVVFDDTTDYDILDRKTADILIRHNPHKIRFESNNVGNRVAHNIQKMITGKCRAEIETKPTSANKETKILVNSDYIAKHFYFLHPSQYKAKSDYGLFMANVTTYTTRAKVPHDDGIDSLAMMAEYVQNPLGGKATAMQNPFWGRR